MRKSIQLFVLLLVINTTVSLLEFLFSNLVLDLNAFAQLLIPAVVLASLYLVVRSIIKEKVVIVLPIIILVLYIILLINLYIQTGDYVGNLGFYYLNIFYATIPLRLQNLLSFLGTEPEFAFLLGQVFFPPLYLYLLLNVLNRINAQASARL